jgi:hypothetical protein
MTGTVPIGLPPAGKSTIMLSCLHCGLEFTLERRRGQYPLHCDRGWCVEERERIRIREKVNAAQRRRHDREVTKRTRAQVIRLLGPLVDGERTRLCTEELGELGPLVDHADFEGLGRPELKAAVVRLAHAEGGAQTRRRLLELAAICIVAARRARPTTSERPSARR